MRILIHDPTHRRMPGTLLTGAESQQLLGSVAALEIDEQQLHRGPHTGYSQVWCGGGLHYTHNRQVRGAQLLLGVNPGPIVLNWGAIIEPIVPSETFGGTFRLVNEVQLQQVAGGLDATERPEPFRAESSNRLHYITGQCRTTVVMQGWMALSLYGIAVNCNVRTFAVAQQ